jgi:hypothetical protein
LASPGPFFHVPHYTSNSNFSFIEAIAFENANWIFIPDFPPVLEAFLTVDLKSTQSRRDTLAILNSAYSQRPPYNIPDDPASPIAPGRFGNGNPARVFFCPSLGAWHAPFATICFILSEPIEDTSPVTPDRRRAYTDAVRNLQLLYSSGFGFFNYISFEAYFQLNWA